MAQNDAIYTTPAGSPVLPDKFDVRIRLKRLTRGEITREEVKKYQSALPDDAHMAEFRNYEALVKDESVEGSSGGSSDPTTH